MNETTNISQYSTVVRFVNDQDGAYYLVEHPELEGCFSDGETIEEALANLHEVTTMTLKHLREHNLPVPLPRLVHDSSQGLGNSTNGIES
jgi:predicted RNase H-like HicB family nuclease